MSTWPTWDEWLHTLSPERRAEAVALRDRFAALGDIEPEAAARSEVTENIPQLARYLVLRELWAAAISWTPEKLPAVRATQRLLAAGADPDDLARAMNAGAFDAVYATLQAISHGTGLDEAAGTLPGWRLLETTPTGELTGRRLEDLHEDLHGIDPSGQASADLWA